MINVPFEKIQEVIKIEDLFEPVKQSFIAYNSPNLIGIPVNLLHFGNDSDAHIKIAAIKSYDYFSIKVATMFPANKQQNLPPYNGAVLLFDAKTGFPKAVLNDRGILTDLRTAAAGAVITDFVAARNAERVAVIGTGIQAYTQVTALAKLRKISQLNIWGRNEQNVILLKKKIEKVNPEITIKIAVNPEQAVKSAEIIITTTPSRIPLVKGEWLQKGQHITAVGADDTFKNEIDDVCLKMADSVFVDSLELNEKYGEFSHAIKANPELIHKTTEFGMAFQNDDFSNQKGKITVAKLVGLGVQDLAAATVVMNKIGI